MLDCLLMTSKFVTVCFWNFHVLNKIGNGIGSWWQRIMWFDGTRGRSGDLTKKVPK